MIRGKLKGEVEILRSKLEVYETSQQPGEGRAEAIIAAHEVAAEAGPGAKRAAAKMVI